MIHVKSIGYDCKDPKVSDVHDILAQLDKHKTLDPVMIRLSPTGGNIFCCKILDANIANIGNFVLTAKISCSMYISIFVFFILQTPTVDQLAASGLKLETTLFSQCAHQQGDLFSLEDIW